MPLTIKEIMGFKNKKRITALTAYDFTMAKIISNCGIDIILVGDSLAHCFLGEDNTLSVTVDNIIYHTKAVVKGAKNPLIVADMPFLSYQISVEKGLYNAGRLIKEGGAHAVKFEGGSKKRLELIEACIDSGIPVMGHIGLTPQSINIFGGYKIQGKNYNEQEIIYQQALNIEKAGAFALVLECVPYKLTKRITEDLNIPVIGIGAGPYCDGQILVINDILGLTPFDKKPKFIKEYGNIAENIKDAIINYKNEVENNEFPNLEHSFK